MPKVSALKSLRDRLLTSPKFQSWAARFWGTRWVARREAKALFDICAGFVYAQTLAALVELRVFERVRNGPLSIETLASDCAVPLPAMRMLAGAGASLRLLEVSADSVRLGGLGAALLGNAGVTSMIRHHREIFYPDLLDPVGLLRGQVETRLSKFWPYRGAAGEAEGYSDIMAATQPMIAAEILGAYNFGLHTNILDVGGGDGRFLVEVAARAPRAQLRLFDLPAVADLARTRFAAAGLSGRAQAIAGDFGTAALPAGADLITLVRVLHDHDDENALALLRAVHAALPAGGALLVAEPLAAAPGAASVGAAYFGFYLAAMGSGRARTAAELETMLRAAGFSGIRQRTTRQPMLAGLLTARA